MAANQKIRIKLRLMTTLYLIRVLKRLLRLQREQVLKFQALFRFLQIRKLSQS